MRIGDGFYFLSLAALLWSVNSSVHGQACCTLQGFNGNAMYGSIADFDGLDFSDPHNRTQIQFQLTGSDDWDGNSFIVNGPFFGYLVSVNHFAKRNVLLGMAISGNISSISEILTIEKSRSNVILHTFQLRANWLSKNRSHTFWAWYTQPAFAHYSNPSFPFTLSPPQSLEIGYGFVKNYVTGSGKSRVRSVRANIRKDAETDNLYQFRHYATVQFVNKFVVYSTVVPFLSVYLKQGTLKPLEIDVYRTRFPATSFAYGLVGGGVELTGALLGEAIVRVYGLYPVLRWSNRVLPAGFEEKPILGLTIAKSFVLKRKELQ